MTTFYGRFHWDFSQPQQALRQLRSEIDRASTVRKPTSGELAEIKVSGQQAIREQSAAGLLPGGATGLARAFEELDRVIRRVATDLGVRTPGQGQLYAASQRLGISGIPETKAEAEAERQQRTLAALTEQRALNPAGATNQQMARLRALQARRPVGSDIAAEARVKELTAIYRQIPEAIRERLGLDIADVRNAVRMAQGLRTSGSSISQGQALKSQVAAYNKEIALRQQIADERGLAELDGRVRVGGRFTSPVNPNGPLSGAKAQAEVLQRRREVAEQLALEKMLTGENSLAKATAELAAMRRLRAAREKLATETQVRDQGVNTAEGQANAQARINRALTKQAELIELEKPVTSSLLGPRGQSLTGASGATGNTILAESKFNEARAHAEVARETQAMLAGDRRYIEATAAAANARARLARDVAAEQRAQLGLSSPRGGGGPTLFQRGQARLAQRQDSTNVRDPLEFQRAGQFLASRALTTAGFAASGAILYGGVQFLKEMVREASELQIELGLVRSQFDDAGISAERFGQFRGRLIEISKETGVAADELARLSRSLLGVFRLQDENGQDVGPDVGRVEQEVDVAARFSTVTGVSTKQIKDDMVAVVTSFRDVESLDFESIADQLVGLENRTGVAAGELLNFTSTLAPLAAELGFTSKELAILGATAAQVSGKSPTVLAENIGRVITDLSDRNGQAQRKLIDFYASTPSIADQVPQLAENFAAGNVDQVLIGLLEDYGKLDSRRKSALAEVFGKREAQSFVALLNNANVALRELNLGLEEDDGAFDERWKEHAQTVTFAFSQMERAIEELGIALFEAGLAEALGVLAVGGKLLVEVFKVVLDVFAGLNDVTNGGVGRLLGVAAAIKIVTAAVTALRNARIANTVTGAITSAAATGATSAAAGAGGGLILPPGVVRPAAPAAAGLTGRLASGLGVSAVAPGLSGAGLAAAVYGPLAALAAITYGFTVIQSRMQKAAENAEKYSKHLKEASDEDIDKLRRGEDVSGFSYSQGITGGSQQNLAAKEFFRRQAASFGEAAQAALRLPIVYEDDSVAAQLAKKIMIDRMGQKPIVLPKFDPGVNEVTDFENKVFRGGIDPSRITSGESGIRPDYSGNPLADEYKKLLRGLTPQDQVKAAQEAMAALGDPEELTELINAAIRGDDDAKGAAIAIVLEYLKQSNPELAATIEASLEESKNRSTLAAEAARAASILQNTAGNFELTVARAGRGERTQEEIRKAYEFQMRNLDATLEGFRAMNEQNEQTEQARLELRAQYERVQDELYKGAASRASAIGKITGRDSTLAQVEQGLKAIRDPNTSLEGDLAAAGQVAEALRENWKKRLANITNSAELQRAIDEGFELPDEVKTVLVQSALDAPDVRAAATQYFASTMKDTPDFERQQEFARKFAEADEAGREAIIKAIRARQRRLEEFFNVIAGMGGGGLDGSAIRTEIENLDILADALAAAAQTAEETAKMEAEEAAQIFAGNADKNAALASSGTQDPQQLAAIAVTNANDKLNNLRRLGLDTREAEAELNNALNQQREGMQAAAESFLQLRQSATDDPMEQANLGVQIAAMAQRNAVGIVAQNAAAAQMNEALRQRERAEQEIEASFIKLQAAQAGNDPIARAEASRRLAAIALANADGVAARNEALIQGLEADRQAEDALLSYAAAQSDLAIAIQSGPNGDPSKVAELRLAAARANPDLNGRNGPEAQIRAFIQLVEAQQGIDQLAIDIKRADEELFAVLAQGDGVASAEAALNAARAAFEEAKAPADKVRTFAALVAAQRAYEASLVDVAVAEAELAAAVAAGSNDALGSAQANLLVAQIKLDALVKSGAGAAEIARAKAAVVSAQAQVRNAIVDALIAQTELVGAIADASGDIVGSAMAQLQAAMIRLSQAGGPAERSRAAADVIRAQAAVRDAKLQDSQSDIDFALQMEQITTAEAIKQLEALLQIPNLTKQQTQQLLLKIKQMRDELGGDFQMNLPSFLGLPTLYEARRVDQTPGGAGSYQDNRQVLVQVVAGAGMDEEALAGRVASRLAEAIGAGRSVSPTSMGMYR